MTRPARDRGGVVRRAPAILTAAEVRASNRERSSVNHATYKIIYGRMCTAIREFTRLHPRETTYFFALPPIILGRPLYDVTHAVRYCVEKSARHGFRTQIIGDAGILLDWTPAPVVRKPAAISRQEVASRNHDEYVDEGLATKRKLRASHDRKIAKKDAEVVLASTSGAKQTAHDLNLHLESLLKTMG